MKSAKRFLDFVVRLVAQNFWWKLASLALATAVWAVVASEPELSTFATIRVAYRNLPEGLEITSDPVTTVTLELRGPSGQLRGLGEVAQGPAAVLDVGGVAPGERTFPIGDDAVRLPRRVHIVRAIPSEIRLRFEKRLTRQVPVYVSVNDGRPGYYSYSVSPAQMAITGPASHVEGIKSVTTDPVDLSQIAGSKSVRVNAFVDDPLVRFSSAPQVTVSVTVKRR